MSGVNIGPGGISRLGNQFSQSIAAAQTTAIASAVAGFIIRVYRALILPSAANNVTFQDSSGGALQLPVLTFTAVTNSVPTLLDFTGEPWLTAPKGLGLQVVTSTAAPTAVALWWEVSTT
jgi:hypothetical protein